MSDSSLLRDNANPLLPAVAASTTNPPEVVVVGTLPPPTTGMTLLTEHVVKSLQTAGPVTILNWSSGLSRKGVKFRVARVFRVLRSLIALLRRGRAHNARLYLVCNSSHGLYLTCVFVACARWLGYPLYLHHHVYSYIDTFDRRMAWIDRRMKNDGTHVVHCEKMKEDFRRRYSSQSDFVSIFPSALSPPLGQPRRSAHHPFRLGHLSNLTIDKGLDAVVETFNKLIGDGQRVELDLAGPVQPGCAQRLLEATLAAHPDSVRYRGPVFGDDKMRFFSEIDAFLFPTKYRHESWGIVLHEAMAAGVPVITYDRGCTQTVVGDHAGIVIERNGNFPIIAAAQIQRWIDQDEQYRTASQAAIEQASFLQREGQRMLAQFVQHMFSSSALGTNVAPCWPGTAEATGLSPNAAARSS